MTKKNLLKSSLTVAIISAASLFGFSSAFGYGGGGGGGVINYCSSVTYGAWGPNVNGIQYRDVASQTPANCSLSTSQQLARSRSYVEEPVTPVVETPVVMKPVLEPIKQVLGEKKYAEGTLIRYKGDSKIYVIINGEKHHIKTLAELRKYAGKKILTVSDDEEVLGEKTYADGSLLRGSDKKIYVLKNGKLSHIKTLAELRKYAGQKIYDVADSVIDSLR